MGKMGPVNLHLTHLLSSAPLVTRLFYPYAPQGEAERSVAVTRVAGEPPAGSRRGADMKEDNNIARISFFIHILFLFIIGISFILII